MFVFFPRFRNTFSVLLGDKMIFEPCGDSNETNLIYTNNKTVFEQCIPRSNLSDDTIYNDIGKTIDHESYSFIAALTNKEERERERERKKFLRERSKKILRERERKRKGKSF